MPRNDELLDLASELIRVAADRPRRRRRRQRRRHRRDTFRRVLRTIGLLAFTSAMLVAAVFMAGFVLGPRWFAGLFVLPPLLIASWAAILYRAFGRKPPAIPAQTIVQSDLAQLPARTEEWLDQQRRTLPFAAQQHIDGIALQLEAIAPQLAKLEPQTPAAVEVRRLLGEELPELVNVYQKVPATLQQKPLNGGSSPDRQLVEGLATVEQEIGRMHERLARDDLHALATQQRYLEIKYKGDDEV